MTRAASADCRGGAYLKPPGERSKARAGCSEVVRDGPTRRRSRSRSCSVLPLSPLSWAPRDFEVSTPGLPAFTADVGFVGEIPDPLRGSSSPFPPPRLLGSFSAVGSKILALAGNEPSAPARAPARSEPVHHLPQHVH